LYEEPFDLFVGRGHRLDGGSAGLADLAEETLLVNAECDMSHRLTAILKDKGVAEPRAHRVATQADLLALLEANLGVAVLPVGAAPAGSISRAPLADLELAREISVYSVAGRRRDHAAGTFYNMLRAAEWPVRPANGARGNGASTGGARTNVR
jgi:DNA-binding transcriptional LysR family regulator